MRRVDGCATDGTPIFAVGTDAEPRTDGLLAHVAVPFVHSLSHFGVFGVPLASLRVFVLAEIMERVGGEPCDGKALAAEGNDACIAVVERRVVDDGGFRPSFAVVGAFTDDCAAPRADVTIAIARRGDENGAVGLLCDARPAEIAEFLVGLVADDDVLLDFHGVVLLKLGEESFEL